MEGSGPREVEEAVYYGGAWWPVMLGGRWLAVGKWVVGGGEVGYRQVVVVVTR